LACWGIQVFPASCSAQKPPAWGRQPRWHIEAINLFRRITPHCRTPITLCRIYPAILPISTLGDALEKRLGCAEILSLDSDYRYLLGVSGVNHSWRVCDRLSFLPNQSRANSQASPGQRAMPEAISKKPGTTPALGACGAAWNFTKRKLCLAIRNALASRPSDWPDEHKPGERSVCEAGSSGNIRLHVEGGGRSAVCRTRVLATSRSRGKKPKQRL